MTPDGISRLNIRPRALTWAVIVSLFALGVGGEFLLYGALTLRAHRVVTEQLGHGPAWMEHLPQWIDPLVTALLLFGHAVIAGILGFVILRRSYRARESSVPGSALATLIALTIVAAYLGVVLAVNTFGE